MQQESWGVLGLEFVDERAERALGFILAERAERVFRVCFGWARWARARFCGKQSKSRKEYYVLKLKASQQKYPFVVDF